jgi:hypothetical protein
MTRMRAVIVIALAVASNAGDQADRPLALMASSAIVGACLPGAVPLALGRVHELVNDEAGQ